MAAPTPYVPKSVTSMIRNFVTYGVGTDGSGLTALQTDLTSAFGNAAGDIQVVADSTTGQTSNALVIVNDNVVFSVPDTYRVSYSGGKWTQLSSVQLAADYLVYTPPA